MEAVSPIEIMFWMGVAAIIVIWIGMAMGSAATRLQRRSFRPAPATNEQETQDDEQPSAQPRPQSQSAPTATTGATWITLDELAATDNLLIIGNRGSGKTTLLSAILRRRARSLYIVDPHNEPDKWAGAQRAIGGGRNFQAAYGLMRAAVATMDDRAKAMDGDKAAKLAFVPFDIASDEWGSVAEEIEFDPKTQPAPGKLIRLVIKEGRKFKLSFIASAHGDTNASLGCHGDNEAFRNSFDWFIYCGAFVKRQMPSLDPPLGRTPEGGTFPLWVVAFSPTTGERRLLDMRGLDDDHAQPRRSRVPVDLEARLQPARNPFEGLEIDGGELVAAGRASPEEYIRELARTTRRPANDIFREVGGNRNDVLAWVREEREL